MKNALALLTCSLLLLLTISGSAQNKQTFTFQGNVFQQYIVPATGWYLLDASGAQGGSASNNSHVGGLGAQMQGYVKLNFGDTLRVAVGGQGGTGTNDGNNVSGGGGGGGSSIIKITNRTYSPLLMAGGGGGGAANYNGSPGLSSQNGGFSSGGTNGSGGGVGTNSSTYGGAGGAGYNSDGGTHYDGSTLMSYGGQGYVNGNSGGISSQNGGNGGWGGGGEGGPAKSSTFSNHDGGGAGGGGYSGGGGGPNEGNGGGGGGSYVATNINTSGCIVSDGVNSGNGTVSIEHLVYSNASVDTTFTFQGNVFQQFIVPATGYYMLTARGGQGGDVNGYVGGKGAHLQGMNLLRAGEVITISVGGAGQPGLTANLNFATGGGGGGASSIVRLSGAETFPLLVAGGGGGAGKVISSNAGHNGVDAHIYQDGLGGVDINGSGVSSGGINGSGGGIVGQNDGGGGGAGGAGYNSDGGTHYYGRTLMSNGGQGYVNGNYGGNGGQNGSGSWGGGDAPLNGGDGGWGGGGEGGPNYNIISYGGPARAAGPNVISSNAGHNGVHSPIIPDGLGETDKKRIGVFSDDTNGNGRGIVQSSGNGGGAGGGGYSGGGGGDQEGGAGGGGGSYNASLCDKSDSSGVNTGNGSVSISGPHVAIDTVNTAGPTYTWAANSITYQHSGTYYYVDQANCIVRVLDLSIGGLGGCATYNRLDTTIVSCGSYTSPLNGRTYTENTTDSIRVGCNKHVVRLIVTAPAILPGNMITGSTASSGLLVVCKNTTQTYTVRPVPYATSYQWTLPSGATGTSTTNSIIVRFSNSFSGGTICVTPINRCGAGATICRSINVLNTVPTGRLQISGPSSPHISGSYSVAPIAGATMYTWNVSNNQARIISGQGTSSILLEALPGFTRTNLTVIASNCKGNGANGNLPLNLNTSNTGNTCGKTTQTKTDIISNTSMSISIFPNPSNGQFTISTPSLKTDATLAVYTTDGRMVYKKIIPANTTASSIDLRNNASGLYQVRIVEGEKVRTVKVIVQ